MIVSITLTQCLHRQCLKRARILQPRLPGSIDEESLANRAVVIIRRNQSRVPANLEPDPASGIPDEYVDDVINALMIEGPRVTALKAGDTVTWNNLLDLIYRRAMSYLQAHYHNQEYISPLNALVEDLVLHCAELLWLNLDRFPFDTSLDAWVSNFVANEARTLRRKADFIHNCTARSLERSNRKSTWQRPLEDKLRDCQTTGEFEIIDRWLTLGVGLRNLSPDQREVIRRQLLGQSVPDIAADMGRTRNAIYLLRHKAVSSLRDYVISG